MACCDHVQKITKYILYYIFSKCRLHKVCAPNLGLHHHETIIKNLDRFKRTNLTNGNTIHGMAFLVSNHRQIAQSTGLKADNK